MAGKKRNSSFEILTAMQDLNTPAGALQLAQILHLPSASIGRELLELEKAGLLVKVQNKGRILTPQGERFLEEERSRREKMKAANELIEAASMETESGLEDILLVRSKKSPSMFPNTRLFFASRVGIHTIFAPARNAFFTAYTFKPPAGQLRQSPPYAFALQPL